MESGVYEPAKEDQMVSSDFEAAETLAGLARDSAVRGEASPADYTSQDQAIAVQQFCGNSSTVVTGVLDTNETVSIVPSQSCSTSYPSYSTGKLRQNLTEAEKEERRIRRVFANRESARKTIRRRQATYLEFTKKAADLAEENQHLRKEKELAVKEYNSLKDRNKYLKFQMSKIKKPESEAMEKRSSLGEHTSSANTSAPFLPVNQPVLFPVLWPSIVPSSSVFQLQYPSDVDISCSSHCLTQHSDTPSVHQGQKICSGSGNPVFVLPVPWLLPCVSHGNTLQSRQNDTLASDYHQSSTNQNTGTEMSNSTKAAPSGSGDQSHHHHHHRTGLDLNVRPRRHSRSDNSHDLYNISALEHQEMGICHSKKPENVVAATNARRRRKELMRLKNIRFHHPALHSTCD